MSSRCFKRHLIHVVSCLSIFFSSSRLVISSWLVTYEFYISLFDLFWDDATSAIQQMEWNFSWKQSRKILWWIALLLLSLFSVLIDSMPCHTQKKCVRKAANSSLHPHLWAQNSGEREDGISTSKREKINNKRWRIVKCRRMKVSFNWKFIMLCFCIGREGESEKRGGKCQQEEFNWRANDSRASICCLVTSVDLLRSQSSWSDNQS